MKYLFNIIAIVLSIIVGIYLYRIKNKRRAIYKAVFIGIDLMYLLIQFSVSHVIYKYMPEEYISYAYKIQFCYLIVFIIVVLIYMLAASYINEVQKKEDKSIEQFILIRKALEECLIIVQDVQVREKISYLCNEARCMDPVCYGVEEEEKQILLLIQTLRTEQDCANAYKICTEIEKLFRLRKIRMVKER